MTLKKAKFKNFRDWFDDPNKDREIIDLENRPSSRGGRGITPLGWTKDEFVLNETGEVFSGDKLPPTVEMFCDWLTFNYVCNVKYVGVDKEGDPFAQGVDSKKALDLFDTLHLKGVPALKAPGFYGFKNRYFYQSPFTSDEKKGGISILCQPDPLDPNQAAFDKDHRPLIGADITGSGCRYLDFLGVDWKAMFTHLLLDLQCRISRIDFSFDFINFDFPESVIMNKLISHDFVSPYWNVSPDFGVDLHSHVYKRFIIRLGSISGDNYVTLYDKTLEQENQGRTLPFRNVLRLEMHFKRDRALDFIKDLLLNWQSEETLAAFMADYVFHQIDFKVPPGDVHGIDVSNKTRSRWDSWPVWTNALGCVEKCGLRKRLDRSTSIDKSARWIQDDVAKTLTKLYIVDPDLADLFYKKVLLRGFEQMKNTDVNVVNDYLKERKIAKLTNLEIEELQKEAKEEYKKNLIGLGVKDDQKIF
jgi:hypothetical protein